MRSLKILLAEDDPNISTIARLALEKLGGHQVTLATDGEMALEQATSGTYDVVLLDEMMPKMNGLNVCRELNRQGFTTPIIFLSAKSQEADIREFREIAHGYIAKPFDPQSLSHEILKQLDHVQEESA